MRSSAFPLLGILLAAPAAASSIEVPKEIGDANSITVLACTACPPLIETQRRTYVVPEIAPNTDRTEVKDIGGRMKIVRTEAWLGGSPVRFVTTPSDSQLAALNAPASLAGQDQMPNAALPATTETKAQTAQAAHADGQDRMTTAALDATTTGPKAAAMIESPSRNFDGKAFQLRLD